MWETLVSVSGAAALQGSHPLVAQFMVIILLPVHYFQLSKCYKNPRNPALLVQAPHTHTHYHVRVTVAISDQWWSYGGIDKMYISNWMWHLDHLFLFVSFCYTLENIWVCAQRRIKRHKNLNCSINYLIFTSRYIKQLTTLHLLLTEDWLFTF